MQSKRSKFDAAVAVLLIALAAVCLATAYGLQGRQAAEEPAAGPDKGDSGLEPQVETELVVKEKLGFAFTRRGTLAPSSQVSVSAEVTSRVVKKHVATGDRVKQDSPILELDGTLLKIRRDEAKARLESAEAQLKEAKAQREDAEKLEDKDDDELKRDTRIRCEAAEAARRVAQTQATEAETTYESRIVRAPLDGTVARCFVEVGEYAASGRPVADIIVTNPLTAEVSLTALEATSLRGSVQCSVATEEISSPAKLARIAPMADPRTKRFLAQVEVENPEGRLRAGMHVDVEFRSATSEPVLLLPRRALARRADRLVCFRIVTAKDGHVAEAVKLDSQSVLGRPNHLRVLAGLSDGDEVAVSGLMTLENGTRVRPVRLGESSR